MARDDEWAPAPEGYTPEWREVHPDQRYEALQDLRSRHQDIEGHLSDHDPVGWGSLEDRGGHPNTQQGMVTLKGIGPRYHPESLVDADESGNAEIYPGEENWQEDTQHWTPSHLGDNEPDPFYGEHSPRLRGRKADVSPIKGYLPWADLQGLTPQQTAFQQTHPIVRRQILNNLLRNGNHKTYAALAGVHEAQSQVDKLRAQQGRRSPYAHPAMMQPYHRYSPGPTVRVAADSDMLGDPDPYAQEAEMPESHRQWLEARGWKPREEPLHGETYAANYTKITPSGIRHSLYWDGKRAWAEGKPFYQVESSIPDKYDGWRSIRHPDGQTVFSTDDLTKAHQRAKDNEVAWLTGEKDKSRFPGMLDMVTNPGNAAWDQAHWHESPDEGPAPQGEFGEFREPKEKLHPHWRGGPGGLSGLHRLNAVENSEGLKAAGIAVIALDTGRVLMQQRALNPLHCPCGEEVTWDEQNGYQHADGSVSHDNEFYGQTVSDLLDQGHMEKESAWERPSAEHLGLTEEELAEWEALHPGMAATRHYQDVGLMGYTDPVTAEQGLRTGNPSGNPMVGVKKAEPSYRSDQLDYEGNPIDEPQFDAPYRIDHGTPICQDCFDITGMVRDENSHRSRQENVSRELRELQQSHALEPAEWKPREIENLRRQIHQYRPSLPHPGERRLGMAYEAALEYDPNEGTWEFPGGKLDPGESPRDAAAREFAEEIGQPLPAGVFVGEWTNNVYRCYIYLIQSEDLIDLTQRELANPDDPDGDRTEQAAWWDIAHAKKNPALRKEVKKTPWDELELWADKSVRANKEVKEALNKLGMGMTDWDEESKAFDYDDPDAVYLRFGDWPADEQSQNHITGQKEFGVSVYDMDKDGHPIDSDSAMNRGMHIYDKRDCGPLDEDGRCEEHGMSPDERDPDYLNGTLDVMRDRVGRAVHTNNMSRRDRAHLVKGELAGFGHDDEPLLRNVRSVGHWPCDAHKFIPGMSKPGSEPQVGAGGNLFRDGKASWCDHPDHDEDMRHEAKAGKCSYCKSPATKEIKHSEGMALIAVCDNHLVKGKEDAAACVPYGDPDPSNIDWIHDASVRVGMPRDDRFLRGVDLSYRREGGNHVVDAHLNGVNIGYLKWRPDGIVHHVYVDDGVSTGHGGHQGKGLATEMWNHAEQIAEDDPTIPKPEHNWNDISDDALEWARSMGHTPPRGTDAFRRWGSVDDSEDLDEEDLPPEYMLPPAEDQYHDLQPVTEPLVTVRTDVVSGNPPMRRYRSMPSEGPLCATCYDEMGYTVPQRGHADFLAAHPAHPPHRFVSLASISYTAGDLVSFPRRPDPGPDIPGARPGQLIHFPTSGRPVAPGGSDPAFSKEEIAWLGRNLPGGFNALDGTSFVHPTTHPRNRDIIAYHVLHPTGDGRVSVRGYHFPESLADVNTQPPDTHQILPSGREAVSHINREAMKLISESY